MPSRRVVLFLSMSLCAAAARADHDLSDLGPPPEITPAPDGGIAPREPTSVQLLSAKVEIDLDGSGSSERRITYVLSNPGKAVQLRVGFRFSWYTPFNRYQRPVNGLVPRSGLMLEGRPEEIACDDFSEVQWDDIPRRNGSSRGYASAWCSFALHAPAGEFVWKFTVRHDGFGSGSVPGIHKGAIAYPLDAEAAWPGRPKLRVVVSALDGWSRPLLPVSPMGARIDERRIVWEPEEARGKVVVTYDDVAARAGAPVVAGGTGYTAVASSTLRPQGRVRYAASQVVDGDQATAWCEGVPGPGLQEWVEVRTGLDPAASARCRLDEFLLVPGYARSDASWRRNGRVRRYRITSCADATDGFEEEAATDGEPRLLVPPRPLLSTEKSCFRLTISDVWRGRDPDTCVSEFMPIFSCAP